MLASRPSRQARLRTPFEGDLRALEGAGCPVDVGFGPTGAKRRPKHPIAIRALEGERRPVDDMLASRPSRQARLRTPFEGDLPCARGRWMSGGHPFSADRSEAETEPMHRMGSSYALARTKKERCNRISLLRSRVR